MFVKFKTATEVEYAALPYGHMYYLKDYPQLIKQKIQAGHSYFEMFKNNQFEPVACGEGADLSLAVMRRNWQGPGIYDHGPWEFEWRFFAAPLPDAIVIPVEFELSVEVDDA